MLEGFKFFLVEIYSNMSKSIQTFEDDYWAKNVQKEVNRHTTALEYIHKGPVLDLGCGDGFLLLKLKELGILGEGLDISKVAL